MRLSPLEILKLDRERILRIATKTGPSRMRALLAAAQKDLNKRLRAKEIQLGAKADDLFTVAQMRTTLAQIREVMKAIEPEMKAALLSTARQTAELQAESTLRYLNASERTYRGIVRPLPLDHAVMLDRATRASESSLLHRIETDPMHKGRPGVIERYGAATIKHFEEELQLRLVARKSIAETREALIEKSSFLKQAPLYWAERIARTEAMQSSNAASQESIQMAGEELTGMLKILVATFDSRTASDSYAVHGQIRRPNEPFDTWQGAVMHPPARSNDREIVVPHRESWPIPAALKPKTDAQVLARWLAEGRKGSPPSRPRLSTVTLSMTSSRA